MSYHIDGLKFVSGSFSLMPEKAVPELIGLAHEHGIYVSTGGRMEHILTQPDAKETVDKYLRKVKDPGFDVVECSAEFLSIPPDDFV